MIYLEYIPDKRLIPYIECYWSAKADSPPFKEKEALIPDGTIELIFNFGDHYHQVLDDELLLIKNSHVIGVRERSLYIHQAANQDFFCVRFKLGGIYPFFSVPANLYSNTFLEISELLSREYLDLEYQLYKEKNNSKRVSILNAFFLKKLNELPHPYLTTQRFVAASGSQNSNISTMAAYLNLNIKTLERHFKESTGIAPEKYLQIRRFNNAIRLMYSGKYNNLTKIAYVSGYTDQSHFIREFKKFTNNTPLNFLKKQFKIIEVIQPALAQRMSKSYNFMIV